MKRIIKYADFINTINKEFDKVNSNSFYTLLNIVKKYIEVIFCRDSELFVSGRFNFIKMKIYINTERPIGDMFLTLMHEFGHYLTYRDYCLKFNIDADEYGDDIIRRELGAYFHGWKFIKNNSIKISKDTWRVYHKSIMDSYLEEGKIDYNPFAKSK